MVTVTRHQINLSGDGDTGVLPSFSIDTLHYVWILCLGVAVTRRQRNPDGDGDAATKNILVVTVTRHQKSLSGDGDMEVFPSFIANLHYVGILYLGDTVTRRQKNSNGDGDAAPDKFEW